MHRLLFIIGFLCLLCSACFQPENGCLDFEATNFNLTADEPCNSDNDGTSCPCTYPVLSFGELEYVVDSLPYQPDSIYQLESGTFRIANIKFYLSNFQFFRNGEGWERVEDTISLLYVNKDQLTTDSIFTDDFVLINRQNSINMGSIKQSGMFDSLMFVVGIRETPNSTIPDSISNTRHPLADNSMHTGSQEGGYIFNQITLYKDTSTVDPIILNISGNDKLVEIKIKFSYNTSVGNNFSLGTLQVDYGKWFHGINFVGSEADMINQIVKNTPEVFSVSN